MAAIGWIIVEWGPLMAIVLLGMIVPMVVSRLYWRAEKRLDAQHPDNLPMSAGRWLEEEVRRRGLDLSVHVYPSKEEGVDAFMPSARIITLSHKSFVKRDPTYWAAAAHELGHALLRSPGYGLNLVLTSARFLGESLGATARFLILANILFASRVINQIGFTIAIVAAAMYVLVLADEAIASTIAMRVLKRDGRLLPSALRSARSALGWAFFTYLGGFAGQLLLVAERDFVVQKIEHDRHFVPGSTPAWGWLVVAGLLSLFLLVSGTRAVRNALGTQFEPTLEQAQRRAGRRAISELVRGLAMISFVAIVWDQPFGLVFAVSCAIAVVASRLAVAILLLPVLLPAYLVLGVVGGILVAMMGAITGRIFGRSEHHPEPVGPPESRDIKRSAFALEDANLTARNRPPWHDRLTWVLLATLQLAFVLMFWTFFALA